MPPEGQSPASSEVSTSSSVASAELRIKDNLKELFNLIHQVQVNCCIKLKRHIMYVINLSSQCKK
jgi:hypothetical protein